MPRSVEEIIRSRYSCRSYTGVPLSESDRSELGEYISQKITGPLGIKQTALENYKRGREEHIPFFSGENTGV